MTYSYPTQVAQFPRPRARTSGALIAIDILAIIGIVVSCVSLFLHGWVHANVVFPSGGGPGSQILQGIGVDVNKEISRIADQVSATTLAPTMWQYKAPVFQIFFALLVVMAVLLIVALAAPGARVVAHVLALLAGAGAVAVIVVALSRVNDGMKSLPAQIGRAIADSPVTKGVFGLTTGTPRLDSGPGVPLYLAIGGVGLAVLCTLIGLIVAATRGGRGARAV